MTDQRIDPLVNAAILTDTQIRIAFAPAKETSRVVALKKDVRAAQIESMQLLCSRGTVHLQLKDGFAPERHIEMTLPELLLFQAMVGEFILDLPEASRSQPMEDGDALS